MKLKNVIIPMILFPIISFIIIINIINIFYFKNFDLSFSNFTLDYKLIFFDGTNNALYGWLQLVAIIEFYLLLNFFGNKKNSHKNTKGSYDKKAYNFLLKKQKAKRGLCRVEFDEDFNLRQDTIKYKLDFILNPYRKFINKMIDVFKLDQNNKRNTIKRYHNNQLCRAGIPIITAKKEVWVDANQNHSLIIGTTNSGKTYSIFYIAIVLCILSGENMVVNDIKGELYRLFYPLLKKKGYNCMAINFVEPKKGCYYNPLSLAINYFKEEYFEYKVKLRKNKDIIIEMLQLLLDAQTLNEHIFDFKRYENLISFLPELQLSKTQEIITDLANKICLESKNEKDSYWNDSAGDLLEGLILLVLEEYTIVNGQKKFLNEELINFKTINFLLRYMQAEAKKTSIMHDYLMQNRTMKNHSYLKLIQFCDLPKNTLGGILGVLNRVMKKLFVNDDVVSMMSKSDLNLNLLNQQKTAIFIIVHDEKNTYHNLVSIIIQQIYETLISQARQNEKNILNIPMNFFWDEFANGSRWEAIVSALTASRSRGIRFNLGVQDFAQIDTLYGKSSETIKANMMNIIFLLTSDNHTKEEISKMADETIAWDNSKNQYVKTRLISTARLSKLGLGEAVIIRQRKNPFITKLKDFKKYYFYKNFTKLQEDKQYKPIAKLEMDKTKYMDLIEKEGNIPNNEIYTR